MRPRRTPERRDVMLSLAGVGTFSLAGCLGGSSGGSDSTPTTATSPTETATPRGPASVLTNNAGEDEPSIETAVTYTAEPAFDNPADSEENPRLLDGNDRGHDWKDVVGYNGDSNTVTFDFRQPYRFDRFEVQTAKKPAASIVIGVAEGPEAEATTVGRVETDGESGWYTIARDEPVTGRIVTLLSTGSGQHVLSEFKAWGWPTDDRG